MNEKYSMKKSKYLKLRISIFWKFRFACCLQWFTSQRSCTIAQREFFRADSLVYLKKKNEFVKQLSKKIDIRNWAAIPETFARSCSLLHGHQFWRNLNANLLLYFKRIQGWINFFCFAFALLVLGKGLGL
jgi:hypothetical protein